MKRLFPALFATLALAAAAACFLLIPSDLAAFGKALNATVLFYSNFHLLKQAGYFEVAALDKPLLHTWSLSVEEQFYAVWPMLLIAIAKFVPARRVMPLVISLACISCVLADLRLPIIRRMHFTCRITGPGSFLSVLLWRRDLGWMPGLQLRSLEMA